MTINRVRPFLDEVCMRQALIGPTTWKRPRPHSHFVYPRTLRKKGLAVVLLKEVHGNITLPSTINEGRAGEPETFGGSCER